jgi:hypothetical protein
VGEGGRNWEREEAGEFGRGEKSENLKLEVGFPHKSGSSKTAPFG